MITNHPGEKTITIFLSDKMAAHPIIAYTTNTNSLQTLEEMVDALTVHPDTITTGDGRSSSSYHGGHTLLFMVVLRFQDLCAKIMPPARPQALRVVKKLLDKGADPNKFRIANTGSGTYCLSSTPMYTAVYRNQYDVTELLLQYGGNPNIGGENELLFCASGYNYFGVPNFKMCMLLIKYGANINAPTRSKQSLKAVFESHYKNELGYPQHYKKWQTDIQQIHALLKFGPEQALREIERIRLEQERIERERLAKIEAERLERERLERERLAKIEAERIRLEQERLERERQAKIEAERLEQERLERELQRQHDEDTALINVMKTNVSKCRAYAQYLPNGYLEHNIGFLRDIIGMLHFPEKVGDIEDEIKFLTIQLNREDNIGMDMISKDKMGGAYFVLGINGVKSLTENRDKLPTQFIEYLVSFNKMLFQMANINMSATNKLKIRSELDESLKSLVDCN